MKTNVKLPGAMLLVGLVFGSAAVIAQSHGNGKGKGNAYGHDKHHKKEYDHRPQRGNDHHVYDRYDHYSSRESHGNTHRYGHKQIYHRPPHWAYGHHHGHRNNVRYVYYRDYDVYWDCHRGVYITLSGRNWIYSQQIPVHMRHANFGRIAVIDLDYFDDDLPYYLERRRSGRYVSIQARF